MPDLLNHSPMPDTPPCNKHFNWPTMAHSSTGNMKAYFIATLMSSWMVGWLDGWLVGKSSEHSVLTYIFLARCSLCNLE